MSDAEILSRMQSINIVVFVNFDFILYCKLSYVYKFGRKGQLFIYSEA